MQREDGQRFVQPFSDATGGAGIFVPQALGEIREEPRRRLHVARLIGTPHDRLDPRALSLRQVALLHEDPLRVGWFGPYFS